MSIDGSFMQKKCMRKNLEHYKLLLICRCNTSDIMWLIHKRWMPFYTYITVISFAYFKLHYFYIYVTFRSDVEFGNSIKCMHEKIVKTVMKITQNFICWGLENFWYSNNSFCTFSLFKFVISIIILPFHSAIWNYTIRNYHYPFIELQCIPQGNRYILCKNLLL